MTDLESSRCKQCGVLLRDSSAPCAFCAARSEAKVDGERPTHRPSSSRIRAAVSIPRQSSTRLLASLPRTRFSHGRIALDAQRRLREFGFDTNFALPSLGALDAFFELTLGKEGFAPHETGWKPSRSQHSQILLFGSYYGEMLLHHFPGVWQDDIQDPDNALRTIVALDTGARIRPMYLIYERLRDGNHTRLLDHCRRLAKEQSRALEGPSDAVLWANYAQVLQDRGHGSLARRFLKRALRISPNLPEAQGLMRALNWQSHQQNVEKESGLWQAPAKASQALRAPTSPPPADSSDGSGGGATSSFPGIPRPSDIVTPPSTEEQPSKESASTGYARVNPVARRTKRRSSPKPKAPNLPPSFSRRGPNTSGRGVPSSGQRPQQPASHGAPDTVPQTTRISPPSPPPKFATPPPAESSTGIRARAIPPDPPKAPKIPRPGLRKATPPPTAVRRPRIPAPVVPSRMSGKGRFKQSKQGVVRPPRPTTPTRSSDIADEIAASLEKALSAPPPSSDMGPATTEQLDELAASFETAFKLSFATKEPPAEPMPVAKVVPPPPSSSGSQGADNAAVAAELALAHSELAAEHSPQVNSGEEESLAQQASSLPSPEPGFAASDEPPITVPEPSGEFSAEPASSGILVAARPSMTPNIEVEDVDLPFAQLFAEELWNAAEQGHSSEVAELLATTWPASPEELAAELGERLEAVEGKGAARACGVGLEICAQLDSLSAQRHSKDSFIVREAILKTASLKLAKFLPPKVRWRLCCTLASLYAEHAAEADNANQGRMILDGILPHISPKAEPQLWSLVNYLQGLIESRCPQQQQNTARGRRALGMALRACDGSEQPGFESQCQLALGELVLRDRSGGSDRRVDEAMAAFHRASQALPSDGPWEDLRLRIWLGQGIVHVMRRQGDQESNRRTAAKYLQQVIDGTAENDPRSAQAHYFLGLSLHREGGPESLRRAAVHYEAALRNDGIDHRPDERQAAEENLKLVQLQSG